MACFFVIFWSENEAKRIVFPKLLHGFDEHLPIRAVFLDTRRADTSGVAPCLFRRTRWVSPLPPSQRSYLQLQLKAKLFLPFVKRISTIAEDPPSYRIKFLQAELFFNSCRGIVHLFLQRASFKVALRSADIK